MHNAALQCLGLPPLYAAHSITPEMLDDQLEQAERLSAGINVTLPYKVTVAERYASHLSDPVRVLGAVNTVVFHEGRIVAENTDVVGLTEAWRRAAVSPLGRTVALIGAGGAARAALAALALSQASRVLVYARGREAGEAIIRVGRELGLRTHLGDGRPQASLVINASPVLDDAETWVTRTLVCPGVVHDLRYGDAGRDLRDAALRGGHLYIDGTSMLLAQGKAALAHFLELPFLPLAAGTAMERALANVRPPA
jgi:shikimate dehydrogenase